MFLCRRPSSSATTVVLSVPPSYCIPRCTFVDAKIKWTRDPYLDNVVQREKDLKPALSLKNLILSSPCNSLPISLASAQKSSFDIPVTAFKFFQKYRSLFQVFRPPLQRPTLSPLHVKLTPQFLTLHEEETAIHEAVLERKLAAERLVKLLMLTSIHRIPLTVIDDLKFELGLPDNYMLELVASFPEYFRICYMSQTLSGIGNIGCDNSNLKISAELSDNSVFGLELVCWRKELTVSTIQKKILGGGFSNGVWEKIQQPIKFPMSYPPGFDLQKKVKQWTEEWQCLPYISPYENAFHLAPSTDQAEKWTVAVLHELLSLSISKKMELKYIYKLGDYLGFGTRFKKALAHHPGIFYISNKIRTQTVVLREAFRKDFLLEKHPLMSMRHRYIHLMNQSRSPGEIMKWTRTGHAMLVNRYSKDEVAKNMKS